MMDRLVCPSQGPGGQGHVWEDDGRSATAHEWTEFTGNRGSPKLAFLRKQRSQPGGLASGQEQKLRKSHSLLSLKPW